jgi:hypothetical protein
MKSLDYGHELVYQTKENDEVEDLDQLFKEMKVPYSLPPPPSYPTLHYLIQDIYYHVTEYPGIEGVSNGTILKLPEISC